MDINLARTFLEIVATGNFLRAAERLHVTQTAVSARVRTLEELLRRKLFVRNKSGASLTTAGEQFLRYAQTLVQVWERARHQVAVPPGRRAVVTVGGELSLWDPLLLDWLPSGLATIVFVSVAAFPSYGVFALLLMLMSAFTLRALGWQTPPDSQMRIADFDWPVLNWARSMAALHVVRVLAGTLYRASPLWTAYLRWSGARLGRRVYVASLALSDYNLLEFGDDVVIGADVHLSGHTVEGGIVKTAGVRLGRGVTIGLGSVIDIVAC